MKRQGDPTTEIQSTKNALLSFQKAKKTEKHPQEYLQTPPVRSKFRHLARDYQETLRMRMKRQETSGINKWIFKTSMRIVSQPFPSAVRQALKNSVTLSKLKAYNRFSSAALEKALKSYDHAKAKVQSLMIQVEEAKMQNANLKKKLLACDAKRNRTLFLWQKSQTIGSEIRELLEFIATLQKRTLENNLSLTQIKIQINSLRIATEQAKAHSQSVQLEIQQLKEVVHKKIQQLEQYSILRMPNHKEIVSCMFSIGILYQQIFILDHEKSLKGKKLFQQLRQKQPIKDKEFFAKNLNQLIAQSQQNRLIRINCKDSEIVVFKVFTVIFMHCRSLMLTNISSAMKKISYFSEEFRQIYHYRLFQTYIANLIERNKGNQQLEGQRQQSQCTRQNQVIIRVNILTNEANYRFLQWIVSSFEIKHDYYALLFDKTEIQLYLFAIEHLLQKQQEGLYFCDNMQNKYTLRILLHDFEENF